MPILKKEEISVTIVDIQYFDFSIVVKYEISNGKNEEMQFNDEVTEEQVLNYIRNIKDKYTKPVNKAEELKHLIGVII